MRAVNDILAAGGSVSFAKGENAIYASGRGGVRFAKGRIGRRIGEREAGYDGGGEGSAYCTL